MISRAHARILDTRVSNAASPWGMNTHANGAHVPLAPESKTDLAPRSTRGARTRFKIRRDGLMALYTTSRQSTELFVGSKWLPKERKGGTSPGVRGGVEVVALAIKAGKGELQIQNIEPGKWGQKGKRWIAATSFIHTYLLIENPPAPPTPEPAAPPSSMVNNVVVQAPAAATAEPEKSPGPVDLPAHAIRIQRQLEGIGSQAFAAAGMVGAQLDLDRIRTAMRDLAEDAMHVLGDLTDYAVHRALQR